MAALKANLVVTDWMATALASSEGILEMIVCDQPKCQSSRIAESRKWHTNGKQTANRHSRITVIKKERCPYHGKK